MPTAADRRANEFLADDCGQNAVSLASRGSTVIAEILRLSEHIPSAFINPKESQYADIISDFDYFERQDEFERRIQNSQVLLERDEEFRVTHMDLLERFFKLFRSVYGYATELNRFVTDIREAMYLSQTLESVLVHPDGKQLMCEIYYLFGVMLLLMDMKMPGKIREYLIVAYVRYKGAGDQATVDVAHMCRSTGLLQNGERPNRYPEKLFGRVPVDREVIEMIIGRIRSDDIYQAAFHYPAPEHRSTALAPQSSMLVVLLFFCPRILDIEKQIMQEIVAKHFVDNWIVPFYLGHTVDLVVVWSPFKSAYNAIQQTIALDNVQYHLERHRKNLVKLNPQVEGLLREGVLTEQYVLDNITSVLLPCVREANVTLRWFVLHMTRDHFPRKADFKKSYATITNAVSTDSILTLLLGVAQLEFILKDMFQQLLKEKKTKWKEAKDVAYTKMVKLSQYYSGEHVLSDSRVEPLEQWFNSIAERIESLTYADSVTANRKIQKIMKALENVQEFHHVQDNLQVVQFLQDTRQLMRQMIRIINIERKVLITIDAIRDLSYAWELFATHRCFVADIQRQIKHTPRLALQMRSVFFKCSTMLDVPCQRIFQAEENDGNTEMLESVSEYYSSELVRFVSQVLHVIPESIFEALKQIMTLLVKDLKPCPTKLPRAQMKEMSQPDVRRQLNRLTSEIAQFATGILAMETTLVGVIKVEPHQLLEEGIRRELVAQVTTQLDRLVTYDRQRKLSAHELHLMLGDVATSLNGMRSAFEYIQDYVNVHGLQIWLQEFSRVISFNVDLESNAFMQKKIYAWKSQYQSDRIPIPAMPEPKPNDAYSFLGRIVLHLLRMTRTAVYIPALCAWYDLTTGDMNVGESTFVAIHGAIGAQGLSAVDRILCYSAARESMTLIQEMRKCAEEFTEGFEKIESALAPTSALPVDQMGPTYDLMISKMQRLLEEMAKRLHTIGRTQMLRKCIAKALHAACKLQSPALYHALNAANDSLVDDVYRHYANPLEAPLPQRVVAELVPFLDLAGISSGVTKVYVTAKPVGPLAFLLAALFVELSVYFMWEPKYSCLVPAVVIKGKAKDITNITDATSLAYGVVTLLRQFHDEHTTTFLSLMCQFIRVLMIHHAISQRNANEKARKEGAPQIPLTARGPIVVRLLEMVVEAAGIPYHELQRAMPHLLLEEFTGL
jgi:WASH complex subunit strumpellin